MRNGMSILFVNGSPNKDGNTAALAKALLNMKERLIPSNRPRAKEAPSIK